MAIKISLITAVYNNGSMIASALDSTSNQLDVNYELIVIDGGSTDQTLHVIDIHKDQISHLVSEQDGGIYDALNKGLRLASGDVIGFLHSDDLYANQNVLMKVAKVFQDPMVDAVYGDLVYVKKDSPSDVVRYWKSGNFSHKKLGRGWMPPHPTLFIRKSIYDKIGHFDTSYKIAADYDFMLRLLSRKNINVKYIPEVLVKMRLGGASNRSLKNLMRKSSEDYRALRRNRVGGIFALLLKNLSKVPQFFRRA